LEGDREFMTDKLRNYDTSIFARAVSYILRATSRLSEEPKSRNLVAFLQLQFDADATNRLVDWFRSCAVYLFRRIIPVHISPFHAFSVFDAHPVSEWDCSCPSGNKLSRWFSSSKLIFRALKGACIPLLYFCRTLTGI
jgi:hypothetical protein